MESRVSALDMDEVEEKVFQSFVTNKVVLGQSVDVHTERAARVFNVPQDKVTKEQRQFAKMVNYTKMYSNKGPNNGL